MKPTKKLEEEIATENLQLRDTIKRYTRELEQKNRELEIETALEKVRAIALSMKEPADMPEVCRIIAVELDKLAVKEIRNVQTAIFYEDKGTYMNYEYYVKHNKTFITETSYTNHKIARDFANQMLRGKGGFYSTNIKGAQVKDWMAYQKTTNVFIDTYLETASSLNYYWYSLGPVALGISTYQPLNEEGADLFRRFLKVFELAYRRYLDIELAIKQAKEARIETALERVRARTMGMQKSDELREVIQVVYEQFVQLKINVEHTGFIIDYKERDDMHIWLADRHEVPFQVTIPYFDCAHWNSFNEAKEKGMDFFANHLRFEEKNKFYKDLFKLIPGLPEETLEYYFSCPGLAISTVLLENVGLYIENFSGIPYSDEENNILMRFGNVFQQTYTRFLDLKNAEAQAREATIEASLERVRSRSMAMHKSDELKEAGELLWNELGKLGISSLSSGYVLMDKDEKIGWIYAPNPATGKIAEPLGCLHTETKEMHAVLSGWQKQEPLSVIEMDEKETIAHQTFIAEHALNLDGTICRWITAEQLIALSPKRLFLHNFNFKQGYLMIVGGNRLNEEQIGLMIRFTKVFQQTYTRFLDLKNAEAQAREARIETALERVRSRTMAMFKSDELAETAVVVFKQMIGLGIEPNRLYISIINDNSGDLDFWITDENGDKVSSRFVVNSNKNISIKKMYEGWAAKKKNITIDMQGDELEAWLTYWRDEFHVPFKPGAALKRRVQNIAYFSKGFIAIASPDDQPEPTINLLERFAAVFNLTYTRFSDLQQAEAQAREATIEAALEKVRGKAMAMHNSNDLSVTASMVFTELRKLGINPIRCGVGLLSKESRKAQLYSARSSNEGDTLSLVGWVLLSGHSVLESIYDTWLKNDDYYPELSGEQLKSYYELLLAGLSVSVPDWQSGEKQYGHFFPFSVGCLYAWSDVPYNDAEIKILKRFATIIDLTFRRYMDLKKTEAAAKEVVKQAALDRVRADIASMRTTGDLDRITPLIWNELTVLGIPFVRCGVFIMDESQQLTHTFLSTPEGKAIGAFHLPYNTPGNFAEVVSNWQQKKIYIDHWGEEDFRSLADILVKQGAIGSREQYMSSLPREGIHLHFLPFLQGMLYVGNTSRLGDDEIKLIQSVADAFSTAYARYEDFNKLEAAKQQVEKTLVDLKQAQQQLVQSEKMASLGELTAGIAHEIQNPLNFVNNFSEVSRELIGELKIEKAKQKTERDEALEEDLLNDISQNLEKINHHGKRADAIVKGMLQHSRATGTAKEPVNINTLADEYIRLCYHGLRAKDKLFNSAIETDFDSSIEKINIIPQDIGRVILNIMTNAFYAVNDRKKMNVAGYEPVVSVHTKRMGDKVEIKVADNGGGIPKNIIDKIFQPFFTTKPTGQGTGLGLSLSYDIVKAHGGELKVETEEGMGSTFIVVL